MIKHIVCFKLKDNSPEECNKAAEILRSMEGKVDLIRDIEVGVDFYIQSVHTTSFFRSFWAMRKLLKISNDEYHCNVVKTYARCKRIFSCN